MMSGTDLRKELAALELMTPGRLREKYRELFGDESRSKNRQWLYRRCAWRVQELAYGPANPETGWPIVKREVSSAEHRRLRLQEFAGIPLISSVNLV